MSTYGLDDNPLEFHTLISLFSQTIPRSHVTLKASPHQDLVHVTSTQINSVLQ